MVILWDPRVFRCGYTVSKTVYLNVCSDPGTTNSIVVFLCSIIRWTSVGHRDFRQMVDDSITDITFIHRIIWEEESANLKNDVEGIHYFHLWEATVSHSIVTFPDFYETKIFLGVKVVSSKIYWRWRRTVRQTFLYRQDVERKTCKVRENTHSDTPKILHPTEQRSVVTDCTRT